MCLHWSISKYAKQKFIVYDGVNYVDGHLYLIGWAGKLYSKKRIILCMDWVHRTGNVYKLTYLIKHGLSMDTMIKHGLIMAFHLQVSRKLVNPMSKILSYILPRN